MSKKKDFEYNGRIDDIHQQNDGDEIKQDGSDHQPDDDYSNSNNLTPRNDDVNDSDDLRPDDSPNIQQVNDDVPSEPDENLSPDDNDLDSKQISNDDSDNVQDNQVPQLDNENDTSSNSQEDDSNGQDNNSNDENDQEDEKDETSSTSENSDEANNESGKDAFDDEEETDSNDLEQNSDDDLDDSPEQTNDDPSENSGSESLKDKAMEKIDPALAKASNLKDLTNKSKEQAKEELIEISKSLVKKKATAIFVTYIAPILLPIIAGLLIVLLLLVIILGAISVTNNSMNQSKDEGCSVEDKSSTSIKSSKDADKNAENIYKYLKSEVKGAKSKAVAAHLGNMYVESAHSFDPSTVQGGSKFKKDLAMDGSAGGYALGIAQWDSERRVNLIKYAEKKKKKWDDLEVQMDFMINHDGSDSDTIKKLLKDDGSINEVTEKIMNEWERAGDTSSISERKSAASKYYSKFSKLKDGDSNIDDATDSATDNSDAGANSGCNDDSTSKTDGELGKSVKANDGSGEVLKQWKSKDKIPEKYKKHIELPDFTNKKILKSDKNIFPATGNLGECTELTWAYMSQLWKGEQPTDGNGNEIYKAYKGKGSKTTNNPTVGYGFSSNPPYAGASLSSVGHTGVVIGVMDDGKWLMSNYNLNGEGSNEKKRVETFALVDGNKKKGGITFFSGVGDPKIKNKGKK